MSKKYPLKINRVMIKANFAFLSSSLKLQQDLLSQLGLLSGLPQQKLKRVFSPQKTIRNHVLTLQALLQLQVWNHPGSVAMTWATSVGTNVAGKP